MVLSPIALYYSLGLICVEQILRPSLYKGYKHELETPLLKAMRDFQKENRLFVRKHPNWVRFIIRLSIILGITYPVFRLLEWLIKG